MPWKETSVVDERMRFIVCYNEREVTFSRLCEQFGISRKTGYKWLARYEQLGVEGLLARRCVAKHCPHATAVPMVQRVIELRKEHPTWGPKKLKARLESMMIPGVPAASTIGTLLKTHGLIRPRRRRVYGPVRPNALAAASVANDTWCVDFKGDIVLGDRTRCYPLTVTDQVSRYVLKCEALTRRSEPVVRKQLERAFCEYGLPLRIRSDNGTPFGSTSLGGLSALSVSWIQLGITPELIEPGHPEQNGRHERMHRTLKQETACPPQPDLVRQQQAFDRFRHIFNDVRPHEALGQKPPVTHYSTSPRPMPSKPQAPQYPDELQVRRLNHQGVLRFKGQRVHVTRLLANQPVGIETIENHQDEPVTWQLYYGPVLLADLTFRDKQLTLRQVRR